MVQQGGANDSFLNGACEFLIISLTFMPLSTQTFVNIE